MFACDMCGGTRIVHVALVDINTKEIVKMNEEDLCLDCNMSTTLRLA